jgi:hypothetical protein
MAACLWPLTAGAQLIAPREAAPVPLGPVSLYPKLRIVDAGKDTNVFNDSANPREDYTLTATSTVLAVVKLASNELLLSSSGDYMWFRRFRSERSNNGHYGARLNFSASRFNPFVGGIRTVTESRPNPEIDARARRIERTATAGLGFDVSERTAVTAAVQFDDSTYDSTEIFRGVELAPILNRRRHTVSGGMRYVVTPFTTLAIAANYAEDVFPQSHLRDAKSYSVRPTFEFDPEAMIHGQVTLKPLPTTSRQARISTSRSRCSARSLSWVMSTGPG